MYAIRSYYDRPRGILFLDKPRDPARLAPPFPRAQAEMRGDDQDRRIADSQARGDRRARLEPTDREVETLGRDNRTSAQQDIPETPAVILSYNFV